MKSSSKILIGYAVAIAVIVVLTFFTYRNFEITTTNSVGYRNTLGLLKNIEILNDNILKVESAGRDIIVSENNKNKMYYQNFEEAVNQTYITLDSFKTYSKNDKRVETISDSIENYINKNIAFRRKINNFFLNGQNEKAYSLIYTMNGKIQMDSIRLAVSKIETIGREELHNYSNESNKRERKTLIVFFILSGSVFLFLGFLIYKIVKENNARAIAESSLKKLNEDLEYQIQKKSAELNIVFDRITDAMIALDKNWNYTYVNKKAGELHNRDPKDLIGKNIWKEFPDVVKEPLYASLHSAMEKQEPVILTAFYALNNSWYEDFIYPSPDGVSVYYRDITEKKIAEEKIKLSEEQFRTLYEENPLMNFTLDGQGKILSVNKRGALELGYTKSELTGKSILKVFSMENHSTVLQQISECIKNPNQSFSWTIQKNTKSGETIFVSETGTSLLNENNEYEVLIVCENITERKLSEQKIRASEEKFRMLIENSHDAISLINENGELIYLSPAGERITGFTSDEIKGRKIFEFLHTDSSHTAKDFFESLYQSPGKTFYRLNRILHKNGNYIVTESNVTNLLHDENVKAIITNFRDISERLLAQDELQKSELKYRSLVEQASDSIFMADHNLKIINANTSACKLLGYQLEDLLKMNISDLFFESDLKNEPIKIDELNSGVTVLNERYMRGNSGVSVPVEINSKMLPDGRFQGIVRNITERKIAEQKKLFAEKKYRLLFERNLAGVYRSEVGGKILECNDAFLKIFGYTSVHDFEKNSAHDLYFNAQDRVDFLNLLKEKKSLFNYEIKMKRQNGSAVYLVENCTLIESVEYPNGILEGIIIDLTERKKAEEKIRESELKFRGLIEQAPDGIFISGADHFIQEVNASGCKMLGYNLDEMHKMKFMNLISPENLKNNPVNYAHLNSGNTIISERILIRKDGTEFPVEISARLLSDGRFQSFIRDISERKKTKEELHEMNSRLRSLTAHIQNAREEERKYIAREIHDELGQLLTGLKIDISWMNKRQGLSAELLNKTEEMLQLTDRTIQSVRKIATELRPGILDDLGLYEAIIWQANEFQNKTGIKCKVEGEIVRTDYSPEQNITAFRILQESLTNVMRHANANHVIINLEENNDFLTLEIIDDGKGIETENRAEQKSLGIMGMNERASIIGGELYINSNPLTGTTVIVKIPFKQNS